MNQNRKKQFPKTEFLIRVYEEGFEILEIVVITDNRSSDVSILSQRNKFAKAMEPVATAMGAAAFWIWKQTFRDSIFPELVKKDQEPPSD